MSCFQGTQNKGHRSNCYVHVKNVIFYDSNRYKWCYRLKNQKQSWISGRIFSFHSPGQGWDTFLPYTLYLSLGSIWLANQWDRLIEIKKEPLLWCPHLLSSQKIQNRVQKRHLILDEFIFKSLPVKRLYNFRSVLKNKNPITW